MTPSEFAAVELALWQQALQEQRDAEDKLERARRKGPRAGVFALKSQVEALRIRADLLLAEAVQVQCRFRDGDSPPDSLTSSRMGLLDEGKPS